MRQIDGPRIAPRSGRPRRLVVLLHGYGANGDDLIALGQAWQQVLPETAFVSPNAPEPMAMAGPGAYQWFPLSFRDPDEYRRGVVAAAPVLEAFLARELARHGLGAGALALVGFSQGTMMALHVGLRLSIAPAAIVGFSGMLAGPEHLAAEVKARPPVLLVHGEADEVIPCEMMHAAASGLAEAGIPVQWHASAGLGHGIDPEGLRHAGSFLAAAFRRAAS